MINMLNRLIKTITFGAIFAAFVTIAGYFIYCAIILIWSPPPKNNIETHDAIIALTGGAGRIGNAFELLIEKKAPKLLISGVLNNVTMDELIKNNSSNLSPANIKKIKNHCCISLDYIADTTETNAIESSTWILKKKIKSIILVTSSSHMPRSYLQFHREINNEVRITPYPIHLKKRLDLVMSVNFWSYAAREYIKFCGSWIRLERI